MGTVIYDPRLSQRGLAAALATQALTLAQLDAVIAALGGVVGQCSGTASFEAIVGSCQTMRRSVAGVAPTAVTACSYVEIFDDCMAAAHRLLCGVQHVLRNEIERRAAAAEDRPRRPSSGLA